PAVHGAFNIGALYGMRSGRDQMKYLRTWSTYETSVEARSLLTKVDPPSHLGSSE
ncbi:hypothetical protein PISMIDRAFT_681641, partial [Pisolithus microcarpus 441]